MNVVDAMQTIHVVDSLPRVPGVKRAPSRNDLSLNGVTIKSVSRVGDVITMSGTYKSSGTKLSFVYSASTDTHALWVKPWGSSGRVVADDLLDCANSLAAIAASVASE